MPLITTKIPTTHHNILKVIPREKKILPFRKNFQSKQPKKRGKKIYFHYKFCGIDSYKISSSCLAVIISVVSKIQLEKKLIFPR